MKYIGYQKEAVLPIQPGMTVIIPRGTKVKSTNPSRREYVTKCARKVRVHHLLPGCNIPDYDYHRYYSDSKYANAPSIKTDWGTQYAITNPSVCWPGTGGYWCEVDINDVMEMK